MTCSILRWISRGWLGHRWVTAPSDDDVCRRGCGAIRYWPSGHTAEPKTLTPEVRAISRAHAGV